MQLAPPSAGRVPVRWHRARRAVAAALAAAFAVLLPASVTSAWIRGTILSTSGYVAAVTPVAASPAVRAAVQDAVASRVGAAVSYAEASLPPSARGLAGLLGSRLAGFAGNGVGQLMAGQAFQQLWADANRLAHSQIIGILNGDSAYVTAAGGEVVLNLLPLVNDVLHTVSRHLSAMTGGAVSLSPVTTLPAAACHALNRTASSACTQIPLFPVAALAGPRHGYRLLVASLSLVLVLTTLALAGALAASPRRRRTLLQLAIGGTLTVLVVMTAVSWGQASLIGRAAPRYQAVTGVIVHALTAGFFTMTAWCVAGGLAVTAIALLSGPYRWATAIRATWAGLDGLDAVAERHRVGQCRHVEGPVIDKLPEADGQVGGGVRRRDFQIAGTHRAVAGVRPGQGGICRLAGCQIDGPAAGVVRPEGAAPVGDRRQDPVAGVQ
jgi:hypothetical protein